MIYLVQEDAGFILTGHVALCDVALLEHYLWLPIYDFINNLIVAIGSHEDFPGSVA
jgi:hypothetical protein